MDIQEVLARNVRVFREARRWSQEELADRANVHRTYVSQVERSLRNPTITVVDRLARALKVTASELLKAK